MLLVSSITLRQLDRRMWLQSSHQARTLGTRELGTPSFTKQRELKDMSPPHCQIMTELQHSSSSASQIKIGHVLNSMKNDNKDLQKLGSNRLAHD